MKNGTFTSVSNTDALHQRQEQNNDLSERQLSNQKSLEEKKHT